ncbi:MAG: ABC transporter substrate-binding protein, partial [Bosea sp. (in: a-proteobacteria)]|nr:ABC transporter substrate-binding protein [Bosea sp. (in: a-proteobacteria)]
MSILRTAGLVAALLASTALPALAQTRAETLRHVTGAAINTLDPNIPGSTREAFGLSLLTYDRLLSFGKKQLDGKWVFDLDKFQPELAESYTV